jgi:small RNA 2'-O-methyltransferase
MMKIDDNAANVRVLKHWSNLGAVEPSELHQARIDAVLEILDASGARAVADLGCGDGVLTRRILEREHITRIVAVDLSSIALMALEQSVSPQDIASGRLLLIHGSFAERHAQIDGIDAAVLLETIEHVDPGRLSAVEKTVFELYRPLTAVITTPNQEYNVLYRLNEGQFREASHRFEWTRGKFESWCLRVAKRNGYSVVFRGVGETHETLGSPTQLATFKRHS